MTKKQFTKEELEKGIKSVSLMIEVLKYILEEKENEKEWLINKYEQLKSKEDGKCN